MDGSNQPDPPPLDDNRAPPDLTPRRALSYMALFTVIAAVGGIAALLLCFFAASMFCAGVGNVLPM
jgi:hypothetical protein